MTLKHIPKFSIVNDPNRAERIEAQQILIARNECIGLALNGNLKEIIVIGVATRLNMSF